METFTVSYETDLTRETHSLCTFEEVLHLLAHLAEGESVTLTADEVGEDW